MRFELYSVKDAGGSDVDGRHGEADMLYFGHQRHRKKHDFTLDIICEGFSRCAEPFQSLVGSDLSSFFSFLDACSWNPRQHVIWLEPLNLEPARPRPAW